jgi:hypothetical protein
VSTLYSPELDWAALKIGALCLGDAVMSPSESGRGDMHSAASSAAWAMLLNWQSSIRESLFFAAVTAPGILPRWSCRPRPRFTSQFPTITSHPCIQGIDVSALSGMLRLKEMLI